MFDSLRNCAARFMPERSWEHAVRYSSSVAANLADPRGTEVSLTNACSELNRSSDPDFWNKAAHLGQVLTGKVAESTKISTFPDLIACFGASVCFGLSLVQRVRGIFAYDNEQEQLFKSSAACSAVAVATLGVANAAPAVMDRAKRLFPSAETKQGFVRKEQVA